MASISLEPAGKLWSQGHVQGERAQAEVMAVSFVMKLSSTLYFMIIITAEYPKPQLAYPSHISWLPNS